MSPLMRTLAPLALIVSMLLLYVSFNPGMPEAGLDPSWALGMNELASRQGVFGRDVVFTFGPLAAVYTTYFHPSTDAIVLLISAWLALAAIGCWFLILRRRSPWLWVTISVLCSVTIQSRDALLFAVPLLAALATAFWALDDAPGAEQCEGRARARAAVPVLLLAWAAVGVLPLIKGTMLVLAMALALPTAAFLLLLRHRVMALAVLFMPPLVSTLTWQALGQPLDALPGFLSSMSEVIRGYTEAMAIGLGKPRSFIQLILFITAAILLVRQGIFYGMRRDRLTALFFFAVLAGSLLLSFKAGFVRHDGHEIIAMNVVLLLMCVSFARFDLHPTARWKWLLVGALLWLAVMDGSRSWSLAQHLPQWWAGQRARIDAMVVRIVKPQAIPEEFRARYARIRDEYPLPRLPGFVDVYPTNHAVALAHELPWRPRPVLQSYSAYTLALAQLNRDHLLGDQAPDWIWFVVEPIDKRLASLDDGASWPLLLSDYEPVKLAGKGLVLQRRVPHSQSLAPAAGEVVLQKQASMGEHIELPTDSGPLTLSVQIQRNLMGRLLQTAYKARSLELVVDLKSGATRRKRVISGLLAGEVLLSPLVEHTEEFALLYGDQSLLSGKQVRSVRLVEVGLGPSHWQPKFEVTVRRANAVGRQPETRRRVFTVQQPELVDPAVAVGQAECAGRIDVVNASQDGQKMVHRSPYLRVRGWMQGSGDVTSQLRQPFLLLQGHSGRWRLPLVPEVPLDLAVEQGSSAVTHSVWSVTGDLATVAGPLTLQWAYEDGGVLYACSNRQLQLER